jgi:chromosome segregation ATPase
MAKNDDRKPTGGEVIAFQCLNAGAKSMPHQSKCAGGLDLLGLAKDLAMVHSAGAQAGAELARQETKLQLGQLHEELKEAVDCASNRIDELEAELKKANNLICDLKRGRDTFQASLRRALRDSARLEDWAEELVDAVQEAVQNEDLDLLEAVHEKTICPQCKDRKEFHQEICDTCDRGNEP